MLCAKKGELHTYYIRGRLSVFMLKGWFLSNADFPS